MNAFSTEFPSSSSNRFKPVHTTPSAGFTAQVAYPNRFTGDHCQRGGHLGAGRKSVAALINLGRPVLRRSVARMVIA